MRKKHCLRQFPNISLILKDFIFATRKRGGWLQILKARCDGPGQATCRQTHRNPSQAG